MRIDRARLENSRFPFSFQLEPRFSDLDQLGHINNVALASLLQEGRSRFVRASDLYSSARLDIVVASLLIEFASDLLHTSPIDIGIGILEVGRSSFRFGQVARQNGRIGVYAEVVQVARDGSGPKPLPEEWRRILSSLSITPG